MSNSDNNQELKAGFLIFTVLTIKIFLGVIMPIYAIIKDIQHGNTIWVIADFIFFVPVGTIRGLMYLF